MPGLWQMWPWLAWNVWMGMWLAPQARTPRVTLKLVWPPAEKVK
jgi:hypothetical protein